MISGRQALGSIDQTLNQARDQIATVQTQVTEAAERLIAQQQEQAGAYRELARVRLGELTGQATLDHLDQTESQVLALLERREATLAELMQDINENDQLQADHEEQRRRQEALLDEAVAVVDQAEEATQKRLDADPAYRQQRELAESAGRKALHAAEKAERSRAEQDQKGSAYEDDRLFTYLWQRKYGLPEYSASGLARWLDGKVARLIGYLDARANYARLNEIPVRLGEHAEHLKALAEAEFEKLRDLDEAARSADGIPALEEKVATAQAGLDEIDGRIGERERRHQALLDRQAAYAVGDDEQMRNAIEFLSREFQREDLVSLRDAAIRTPYPEDDVVVSEMLQREDEQRQLESSIEGLKTTLKQHQARVLELEQLRADFKLNRFDRAGSVFTNDAIVPSMLREFLSGMLDSRMLWKVLREHQRYRPRRSDPGFGSGGFGRGTVWRGGLGDVGDILGRIGRGGFGGRGGGGLGGGGLGGGGGFRTGGGF
jgi:hypothetical protein